MNVKPPSKPVSRWAALALLGLLAAVSAAWAGPDDVRCGSPQSDLSVQACTRLLQRSPPLSPDALAIAAFNRAVALKDKGDPSAARQDLNTSIRSKPLVNAYFLRGIIAMDAGNLDAALADYDAALKLEPSKTEVLVDKALVLDQQGDVAGALKVIGAALRPEPGNATALNQRGNLYGKLGQAGKARADWAKAASLDDQFAAYFAKNQRIVRVIVPAPMALPLDRATVRPGSRVALVIGNASYRVGALANPANDARSVDAALRQLGFETSLAIDLDRQAFAAAVRDFAPKAAKAEVAMLYYAGHGLQVAQGNTGENYLLPVDADIQASADVQRDAIPASDLLAAMNGAPTRILVLDACRENPFSDRLKSSRPTGGARSLEFGRGLGRLPASPVGQASGNQDSGTLVVFATAANQVASDGRPGLANSPFSAAFAKYLVSPGVEIKTVIQKVSSDVVSVTARRQSPFMSSSLLTEVYLAGR